MSFAARFQDLASVLQQCSYRSKESDLDETQAMHAIHQLIRKTQAGKGIVYVIGNGGSAGIASHFSNDLMKALSVPSQTLYDSNLMTCLSNDLGYDQVFAYPLERLIKSNDLLVAISSSGKSQSILKAAEVAQSRGASILTLSGFEPDNPLRSMGFLNIYVNRSDYGLVETSHFFLLHAVVDTWYRTPLPMAEYATCTNAPCC